MTIRATQKNTAPIAPAGAKAPAAPDQAVTATAAAEARSGDRLELTSQVQAASTSLAETVARTATAQSELAMKPETTEAVKTEPEKKADMVEPEVKNDAATTATVKPETAPEQTQKAKPLLTNHLPYYTQKQFFSEHEPLIETAIGGQTVSYANSFGKAVDVTITKGDNAADGHEQYRLKLGNRSIEVSVAPNLPAKTLLAKVVEYLSRFPEPLTGGLKTIALETGHSPLDAYWAKTFNNTSFASAATAGEGVITFWNLAENPINLSEDTFSHEMGHLIGESLKRTGPEFATRVPEGWVEAAKADDDKVSNYAGMNPDEDFAETWSYYLFSKSDEKAMDDLRTRVPNRVKILDALYDKAVGKPAEPAKPAPETAPAAQEPPEGGAND